MTAAPASGSDTELALRLIYLLAEDIGPRRPTGGAEARAAEAIRSELAAHHLDSEIEPFLGYSTFAWPIGAFALLGVLPALVPRRRRLARAVLGSVSLLAGLAEGGAIRTRHSPSAVFARSPSQNLVATVEPSGKPQRTVCLVGHLDSSRSGILFHPGVAPHINHFFDALSAATFVQAAEPLIGRHGSGRALVAAARATLLAGFALLAERELRGEDVPGANDNASGTAVAAQIALDCAARPLAGTRVVLLLTGCEESGLIGAKSFLERHDTKGWLFLNFDSVGGPAPLRFTRREGIGGVYFDSDAKLLELAAAVASRCPELELTPADRPIGLTYDTTPVLASGGRAITFIAGDRTIPNYHWPTDTVANIDADVLGRALGAGREMLAAIERGEAD